MKIFGILHDVISFFFLMVGLPVLSCIFRLVLTAYSPDLHENKTSEVKPTGSIAFGEIPLRLNLKLLGEKFCSSFFYNNINVLINNENKHKNIHLNLK